MFAACLLSLSLSLSLSLLYSWEHGLLNLWIDLQDKLDFEDPDTEEFMFKDYLKIIMEKDDLTYEDLHRAQFMRENNDDSSDSDKVEDKDAVVTISDGDSDLDFAAVDNSFGKRKKSQVREYVGWGSKPLIDFLNSVGIDATEKLSQCQVDIIISKYILEKNLFCEEKKKMVLCDEKLYSLFQKKLVRKNKIYNLLEAHFADTLGQSSLDENENDSGSCSGIEEEQIMAECKRQRTLTTVKVPLEKKVVHAVQKSYYASIVA